MESDPLQKSTKKPNSHRRRNPEHSEFESEITLQLDEFFRHFNYYYPGKNKDEIINKCITGNAYWIIIDSQYYSDNVDLEFNKIDQLRKKQTLKNGVFPPTKDSLQEEKFILMLRKKALHNLGLRDIQEVRRIPIQTILEFLLDLLERQEATVTQQMIQTRLSLQADNQQVNYTLVKLGIPIVKSARLFTYEKMEKKMIQELVHKAKQKQLQPRCDFCFTRDKEIVKCKYCQLHAHPLCFSRVPKNGEIFVCDQCAYHIPQNAQCELCPLQGGRLLQLKEDAPINNYHFSKGESNLKFRITRQTLQTRQRQFIHVSCFVLHPECSYNSSIGKVEGIHYIDRIHRKNTSICMICGNMIGLTVSCYNESCRRAYHPECAKLNNLKINVIKANNKSLLEIYCERHKKPESYEYLNDSVSNRIKEIKKFYETLDYEVKRHGVNHSIPRPKKSTKMEENLKWDLCLGCSNENSFDKPITNCRKCYGWRHVSCSHSCPMCDS